MRRSHEIGVRGWVAGTLMCGVSGSMDARPWTLWLTCRPLARTTGLHRYYALLQEAEAARREAEEAAQKAALSVRVRGLQCCWAAFCGTGDGGRDGRRPCPQPIPGGVGGGRGVAEPAPPGLGILEWCGARRLGVFQRTGSWPGQRIGRVRLTRAALAPPAPRGAAGGIRTAGRQRQDHSGHRCDRCRRTAAAAARRKPRAGASLGVGGRRLLLGHASGRAGRRSVCGSTVRQL